MKILNLKLGLGIVSDDNEFVDEKKRVTRRHDRNHKKTYLDFKYCRQSSRQPGAFCVCPAHFLRNSRTD